jgi:hypothetical protein
VTYEELFDAYRQVVSQRDQLVVGRRRSVEQTG